jgi:hypothetical protein
MSDTAYVSQLPDCDIHKFIKGGAIVPATVDGKTTDGRWANMCDPCFSEWGVGLGTGRGQRLIVGERPEPSRDERAAAIGAAIEAGNFDQVEELVGDGDIAEWL